MSRRHRHAQAPSVWVLPGRTPLAEAMHAYNAGVALRALPEDPPAPPKESDMNVAVTPPVTPAVMDQRTPGAGALWQAHNELAAKVRLITADLDQLNGTLAHQADAIHELQTRVDELTQTKPKSTEEIYKRITTYLRDNVPGVWMTPGTVAVNLNLDGKSVAYRLDRMADEGKIERQGGRGSGSHPLYRVVVPPKPPTES